MIATIAITAFCSAVVSCGVTLIVLRRAARSRKDVDLILDRIDRASEYIRAAAYSDSKRLRAFEEEAHANLFALKLSLRSVAGDVAATAQRLARIEKRLNKGASRPFGE